MGRHWWIGALCAHLVPSRYIANRLRLCFRSLGTVFACCLPRFVCCKHVDCLPSRPNNESRLTLSLLSRRHGKVTRDEHLPRTAGNICAMSIGNLQLRELDVLQIAFLYFCSLTITTHRLAIRLLRSRLMALAHIVLIASS